MNLASIWRSTFFRLISLFMCVFLVMTLIIVTLADEAMELFLEDQASAFVEGLMLDNLDFAREYGTAALLREIAELSALNKQSREIYVLFDDSCNVIAGAPERLLAEFSEPTICDELVSEGGVRAFDLPRRLSQLLYQPRFDIEEVNDDEAVASIRPIPEGGSLLIVLLVPEIEETREFFDATLSRAVSLLLVAGLGAAIMMTLSVSRKLEKVNVLSHDIREGDFQRRIPVGESGDEFDNLSDNLNAMLDRIELVLQGSKQVTNDIAHDLRTPLARIQTRIETLQKEFAVDSDTWAELDLMRSEASELLDVSHSLLRIAGIESGRITGSFTQVNFSEVCEDAIELLEPHAEEKDLSLEVQVDDSLCVHGERNLLFQAATNIIENAIKYSPSDSEIAITLRSSKDQCELVVRDSGPGIPKDEEEKVFKRFYRLESHRGSVGHGLGLSLVRAVVEIHQGVIKLQSNDKGLVFTVRLPLCLHD